MPPFDPPLDVSEIAGAFPGAYSDVRVLKTGGQGAVFRATPAGRSPPQAGDVALKVYSATNIEERTDREVAALRRLASPYVVALTGTGACDIRGTPCIWLETAFIEGEPMSELIARGPVDPGRVASIVHDIACAIDAIWLLRAVHRDIKPDNIMIRSDGSAVLIDLGVARHIELDSITSVGKTWGTLGYLSPEQFRAVHSLSCKSDVFALGIVAQEALCGRHPTTRHQPPLVSGGAPTATLRSGLPGALTDVIDRMLQKDPVRRPLPAEIAALMQPMKS